MPAVPIHLYMQVDKGEIKEIATVTITEEEARQPDIFQQILRRVAAGIDEKEGELNELAAGPRIGSDAHDDAQPWSVSPSEREPFLRCPRR